MGKLYNQPQPEEMPEGIWAFAEFMTVRNHISAPTVLRTLDGVIITDPKENANLLIHTLLDSTAACLELS